VFAGLLGDLLHASSTARRLNPVFISAFKPDTRLMKISIGARDGLFPFPAAIAYPFRSHFYPFGSFK
jgi:hypothetical protein